MYTLKDFLPFFANEKDPGPKDITFTWVTPPEQNIRSWLPKAHTYSVRNYLNAAGNAVLQETGAGNWNRNLKEADTLMVFQPSNTEGAYSLINLNDQLKSIHFGEGWHIEKWEIVATDEDGHDIDKEEVDERIKEKKDFFICDKLLWKRKQDTGEEETRESKHGYDHYKPD